MITLELVKNILREQLPQYGIDELKISLLAELLYNILTEGSYLQTFRNPPIKEGQFVELIEWLAGRTINIQNHTLSFGRENSFGNVTIGDIAGRDILNIDLNIYYNQYFYSSSDFGRYNDLIAKVDMAVETESDFSHLIEEKLILHVFGKWRSRCVKGNNIGLPCDFIIANEGSIITEFSYICFAPARAKPFTETGEYTAELNKNIARIQSCLDKEQEQPVSFKIWPRRGELLNNLLRSQSKGVIVIGRRGFLTKFDNDRRARLLHFIEITNYDRLLEALSEVE